MKGQSRKRKSGRIYQLKMSIMSRICGNRAIAVAAAALILCTLFMGINLLHSQAEEQKSSPYNKYYTSIQIQEGDSLWSIAERYRIHSGRTVLEYIQDLREMNSLSEDTIHTGNYLTIYYYDLTVK